MTTLLLFIIGTIGLTHIVVDSVIMMPFRDWLGSKEHWFLKKVSEAVRCYQCAGTWCGFFCAILAFGWQPGLILLGGFGSSFISLLAAHVINLIESKTIVEINNGD